MTHYCTFDEAGPLRQHAAGKYYFLENIEIFIRFAIGIKKYYIENGIDRFKSDKERLKTLTVHMEHDDKEWIKLLEGEITDDGKSVIKVLSKIVASLVVGHEKDFGNISTKEWSTKVNYFKYELKKAYEL